MPMAEGAWRPFVHILNIAPPFPQNFGTVDFSCSVFLILILPVHQADCQLVASKGHGHPAPQENTLSTRARVPTKLTRNQAAMLLTQPLRCWRCRPPSLPSRPPRRTSSRPILSLGGASPRVLTTSSTPLFKIASPLVAGSSQASVRSSRALFTPLPMTQTRGHGGHGHGHGHHHHHDNVYLTSTNKHDAGVRITRIGLVANLGMAIGKFIGGYVFNSQALIADAYHALADLVSDFLTLGTVALSLKPPSERFPNGYGKVESIGALGVSGLLLCGGVFMGLNASQVLLAQFYPDLAEMLAHSGLLGHGHSHSHGIDVHGPSIHAAWLAAGSIVIKEWLYHASPSPLLCRVRIRQPRMLPGAGFSLPCLTLLQTHRQDQGD